MDTVLLGIGERVRKARLSKHLTQQQLAEAVGISVSFLSNIENGRQSMNLRTLIDITNALDVSADSLIRDVPGSVSQIAEEIVRELASCSQKEREAILQLVQVMKKTFSGLRDD